MLRTLLVAEEIPTGNELIYVAGNDAENMIAVDPGAEYDGDRMMKSPAAFPLSAARMWFWFSWRTIFLLLNRS